MIGLAQLVECLTAERLRNEGITFALLQMARPLRGSDARPRKMAVVDVKIVSPIITFVLNTS